MTEVAEQFTEEQSGEIARITHWIEGKRVEGMISTWRDDSELARFNAGDAKALSPELAADLRITLQWAKETGGAFNPLVRPLIDAWKTRGAGAVPSKAVIAGAMKRADLANVHDMVLANGAIFEEGAWGKGLAIDRMLDVLKARGVKHARINFGGQIGQFGDPGDVVIADPRQRDRAAVALFLGEESISTSAGSEKSFTANGRTFTHIIDPRSGMALPPRGSVSVISDSAFVADILSTALYVMSPDAGMKWAAAHNVAAVFITDKNEVLASAAIPGLRVLDAKFNAQR